MSRDYPASLSPWQAYIPHTEALRRTREQDIQDNDNEEELSFPDGLGPAIHAIAMRAVAPKPIVGPETT
jgi:hypothetical protein